MGDAAQAGGNEKQIGADPRRRGGKAGGGISYGGDEEVPHHRARDHLQHTRQNGEGAEAHPLDGKTQDVHQGQGEEKRGQSDGVLAHQALQQLQLRLAGAEEQHSALGREQQHGQQRGGGVDQPQQGTGTDPLVEPVQPVRAHVLAAVGGHCGPHGVKGTGQ